MRQLLLSLVIALVCVSQSWAGEPEASAAMDNATAKAGAAAQEKVAALNQKAIAETWWGAAMDALATTNLTECESAKVQEFFDDYNEQWNNPFANFFMGMGDLLYGWGCVKYW